MDFPGDCSAPAPGRKRGLPGSGDLSSRGEVFWRAGEKPKRKGRRPQAGVAPNANPCQPPARVFLCLFQSFQGLAASSRLLTKFLPRARGPSACEPSFSHSPCSRPQSSLGFPRSARAVGPPPPRSVRGRLAARVVVKAIVEQISTGCCFSEDNARGPLRVRCGPPLTKAVISTASSLSPHYSA